MLFIPVIHTFCTSLEGLAITTRRDRYYALIIHIEMLLDDMSDEHEDALREILEKIKTIETLKELVVFDRGKVEDSIEVARETIEFIKKRAGDRARSEQAEEKKRKETERVQAEKVQVEQIKAVMTRALKFYCDFCGEDCIWAECYNFCSVCADFCQNKRHKRAESP